MSNVNQMSDYAPNMSWTTRTGPKYVYFPCLYGGSDDRGRYTDIMVGNIEAHSHVREGSIISLIEAPYFYRISAREVSRGYSQMLLRPLPSAQK